MSKQWKVKQVPSAEEMAAYADVHPLVATLLWQRGVGPEQASHFLHVEYGDQYDPYLFTQMRKAVDRVWQAITAGERIVIYSDYDADAVTANAVLTQTFRYLGLQIGSYIPDRFTEGYGLNIEAFEKIKADGTDVVITVDCGTNSCDVADWCREQGIDLIITDHHEITGALPDAYALVNPKNPSEQYPDHQITGVGVAYKLAKAILSEKSKVIQLKGVSEEAHVENWDKWLLDLVAIGTVADCHSLLGENRIFVKYGLLVLAKSRWPGLRAVLQLAQKDPDAELTTHTLGFLLAPRINAAGRLEHANIALDTLIAEDPLVAGQAAQVLDKVNTRRQELTSRLISEAREQAVLQGERKILVLAGRDWPKGIVGIAAGRLATEFMKPVIVLEAAEDVCTGSARTWGSFDVVEALKATSEFLVRFGGHKEAAGLSLKPADLENFRVAIARYAETVPVDAHAGSMEVDAELTSADLTLDVFDRLQVLEPFGAGNPKPLFAIRKAVLASMKKVGKEQTHVQFTFDVGGVLVQGIGFSMAYVCDAIPIGQTVDLLAELLADSWNGVRRLKVRVVDVRVASEASK
ncbi:MAG: single-stranded-DNA-specific exonuclease RecJ [Candidatus Doudnabacteria bacterium]|nr:single-stranded-DNA-specific exonuclease RecJ [Candidatus Doudnabacteria bacterium]